VDRKLVQQHQVIHGRIVGLHLGAQHEAFRLSGCAVGETLWLPSYVVVRTRPRDARRRWPVRVMPVA
jgi:hypothetical protein